MAKSAVVSSPLLMRCPSVRPPTYTNTVFSSSLQSARNHILRALNKWPQDAIRPQVQFQDVLRKRFESKLASGASDEEQLKQANALYSLIDNRYKKKVSSLHHAQMAPQY